MFRSRVMGVGGVLSELTNGIRFVPVFGDTIYCIQAPCPQGGRPGQVYTPSPTPAPTPVPAPTPAPATVPASKPTTSALPLLLGAAYLLLA